MIVLDTSFIVSYFNTRDQNHLKAVKLMKKIHEPLCITDYIFGEVVTVSLIRLKSFDNAWNLFCKQKETVLSFTDCTTISVMLENDIGKIATFDGDFGKISKI